MCNIDWWNKLVEIKAELFAKKIIAEMEQEKRKHTSYSAQNLDISIYLLTSYCDTKRKRDSTDSLFV